MRIFLFITTSIFLTACTSQWQPSETIVLDDISPIGIIITEDGSFVLSDGDHNRVVTLHKDGRLNEDVIFEDIERPMHLDYDAERMYVPSYGADAILELYDGRVDTTDVPLPMDAPAAVSVSGDNMAIADFYNHRVLIHHDGHWSVIGEKGKDKGQMHYPTDVHIHGDKVYVADAYNHRIQVWDLLDKKILNSFGAKEKMNAATGLWVDDQEVWITDFENDRVLCYTPEGTLVQIIDQGLSKPTDLYKYKDQLYITNYKGQFITVLSK